MIFKQIIFCVLLAVPYMGFSQGTVRGKIVSMENEPLIGASIRVLGSGVGSITDTEGNFQLYDIQVSSKLVCSYVGYTSDTVPVQFDVDLVITLHENEEKLDEVLIKGNTTMIDELQPIHSELITEKELLKAACCNLSESFETNASVDVSIADAVSGTKMIRMLGLDGRYVLISREGIPHIRGLNSQMGLNYVPGTWIQSIDVGKGAGSVLYGYESMTGQINLGFKRPENSEKWYLNGYINSFGRLEFNVNHATKLSDKWSTAVLLHGNYLGNEVDGNDDGFMDLPKSRQVNLLNRYKFQGDKMVAQIGINYMIDDKAGGQLGYRFGDDLMTSDVYGYKNTAERLEVFGKMGLLFPHKPYKGWGLQYSFAYQDQDGGAGRRIHQGTEKTVYANLIYQNIIGNTMHQYKTGVSYLYDGYDERYISKLRENVDSTYTRNESVPGLYYEYNYIPNEDLTVVAGFRMDFNSLYGTYYTPRLHMRYGLNEHFTLRASAGKGYRTPNALMENMQLMLSSRQLIVQEIPRPEIAWNYGGSLVSNFTVSERDLSIVADYFYTNFENQLIYDQDQNSQSLVIYNLKGKSFAHSFQLESQYELSDGLDIKAAYKYYNVQTTTNGQLQQVPYVSRDRFFVNLAYATKHEKWQADFTWVWNGAKRLPDTFDRPVEYQQRETSPDFMLINAQVSRGFRWGNIYVGAENLLDFKQNNPIIDAQNPFGSNFDASMVWGPVAGRVIYTGIRYKIKQK